MCFFKTPTMTSTATPTLTASEILPETKVEDPQAPVFGGSEASFTGTSGETSGATGISSLKVPKMVIPKVDAGMDITGANRALNSSR